MFAGLHEFRKYSGDERASNEVAAPDVFKKSRRLNGLVMVNSFQINLIFQRQKIAILFLILMFRS